MLGPTRRKTKARRLAFINPAPDITYGFGEYLPRLFRWRGSVELKKRCSTTPFRRSSRIMAKRIPKYRRHFTGQAFVQHQSIPTKDHRMYLGVYGTARSRAKYRQFLEQLEAQQEDQQLDLRAHNDLTVTELVALYLQHCETYYVDSEGRLTKEFSGNKEAVAPVLALFGEDLGGDGAAPRGEVLMRCGQAWSCANAGQISKSYNFGEVQQSTDVAKL